MAVKIVEHICCFSARDNVALKTELTQEGMVMKFEYTAPGTPQQNRQVEQKFETMFGKVRVMMKDAKLTAALCKTLWAANTASYYNSDAFYDFMAR